MQLVGAQAILLRSTPRTARQTQADETNSLNGEQKKKKTITCEKRARCDVDACRRRIRVATQMFLTKKLTESSNVASFSFVRTIADQTDGTAVNCVGRTMRAN